ncbi:MAG: hypothetical protein JWM57_784 [Phycisphaerales bacterium]|nr:hypothetical protein [Phycisphaerales bacterium]
MSDRDLTDAGPRSSEAMARTYAEASADVRAALFGAKPRIARDRPPDCAMAAVCRQIHQDTAHAARVYELSESG